jgi:hypothetical protein
MVYKWLPGVISSELSIRIRRRPAEVYAYLMDLSNYVSWQTGLMEVSGTDGMNVGSVINFTTVGLGKTFSLVARVVENQPEKSFRVVSSRGPVTFDSLYQLHEDGDHTVMTLANKIDTNAVFRLAEPVLQSISDNQYEADLASLRAILEALP